MDKKRNKRREKQRKKLLKKMKEKIENRRIQKRKAIDTMRKGSKEREKSWNIGNEGKNRREKNEKIRQKCLWNEK